jgi:stage V sporulation protein K
MQQGMIRLERKSKWAGALASLKVYVDDIQIGHISNGGVLEYYLSPGNHNIQIKYRIAGFGLISEVFRIRVLSNKILFLFCEYKYHQKLFPPDIQEELLIYGSSHYEIMPSSTAVQTSREVLKNKVEELESNQGSKNGRTSEKKNNGQIGSDELAKDIEQLQLLIGLKTVKSTVKELINIAKVGQMQSQLGIKAPPITRHLVFTGNPGTGKTTVARVIGSIYKNLGVLSKGHFIEVDRTDLVGEYLGQTAPKTTEIIKSALGGVLFIDEAYALVPDGKSDMYGQEAVSALLKMMEDHREELVVIVAGYKGEMHRFIQSNPGLKSRFSKSIHFEDYSTRELTEIFQTNCRQYGYSVSPETLEAVHKLVTQFEGKIGELGNGRFMRNIFDRCIANQCNRLATSTRPSKQDLITFQPGDIPTKDQLQQCLV